MLFISAALVISSLISLSSASHFPVPRNIHQPHGAILKRSFPREPRRLNHAAASVKNLRMKKVRRDGQAYLKCSSRYTFQLCDPATKACTEMGSVAPGTACVDDAITWDSAVTTVSAGTTVVESTHASDPPVPTQVPSGVDLAVKNIVITSGLDAKNPSATSSAAASSSTASSDDSEDDEECTEEDDAEDDASTSSSAAPAAANPPAPSTTTTTTTTQAPTTTPAQVVQAAAAPKPTTTTTTTTTPAPAAQTANLAVSVDVGGSTNTGTATWFTQDGGTGACGKAHQDSDYIVALQINRYGTGSNNAPDCGRSVVITNTANGKKVTATVADACPGCNGQGSLDLSVATFQALGDLSQGVLPISWYFSS